MFDGIKVRTFLSDHSEWHAFVEGYSDGFCPWRGRYAPSHELQYQLECEHHYYSAGRPLGFICLALFVVGVVKLVI